MALGSSPNPELSAGAAGTEGAEEMNAAEPREAPLCELLPKAHPAWKHPVL